MTFSLTVARERVVPEGFCILDSCMYATNNTHFKEKKISFESACARRFAWTSFLQAPRNVAVAFALASRSCESRASRRRCTRARSGGVHAVAMRRETQRLLGAARAMRKAALHGLPRATRERLAPHPPGVRTKASRPTGSNAGATISTSRAKPGMAAQLGLPAIPVEREYLQSWKTLRAAWERCRFVAEIPEALDTDAIGRVCEFRVQGERVAHPPGRSPEREYFGVGEEAVTVSSGSSPGNGAGASATNAAAGETDRSPTIWRWFAEADKRGGAARAGGGNEPALDVWIAAAAVKPPERARSLAFGTPPGVPPPGGTRTCCTRCATRAGRRST